MREQGSHAIRPFMHNMIDELMISKEFFVAAARAYVSNETWEDDLTDHNGNGLHEEGGIVYCWASTVTTSGQLLHLPTNLLSLGNLTFILREDCWADVDEKCIWEQRMTEMELMKCN